MDNLEKNVKTIQSVHRALDILEFAVFSGNGQKLSTITEHCHLNKTTAFHLIKTLEARGYLEQSPDTLSYKTGGKVHVQGTCLPVLHALPLPQAPATLHLQDHIYSVQ